MLSDWSMIVSHLSIITSCEVIIIIIMAGAAKFQISCLTFCQCYGGSDQHSEENTISKSTKDAIKFAKERPDIFADLIK